MVKQQAAMQFVETRDLGELVQNDANLFVGITLLKDCKHCNSLWADSAGT
jgi:hypothetical protein